MTECEAQQKGCMKMHPVDELNSEPGQAAVGASGMRLIASC